MSIDIPFGHVGPCDAFAVPRGHVWVREAIDDDHYGRVLPSGQSGHVQRHRCPHCRRVLTVTLSADGSIQLMMEVDACPSA